MANPTPSDTVTWKRWMRLAAELIVAALIISAPVWDGLTTIPPR